MRNEMWSHENSTLEFRQGYREGLSKALSLSSDVIQDIKNSGHASIVLWLELIYDEIDEEMSMYEVGDEE